MLSLMTYTRDIYAENLEEVLINRTHPDYRYRRQPNYHTASYDMAVDAFNSTEDIASPSGLQIYNCSLQISPEESEMSEEESYDSNRKVRHLLMELSNALERLDSVNMSANSFMSELSNSKYQAISIRGKEQEMRAKWKLDTKKV